MPFRVLQGGGEDEKERAQALRYGAARNLAMGAADRGKRSPDEPTIKAKLAHWGDCEGQTSLFGRDEARGPNVQGTGWR